MNGHLPFSLLLSQSVIEPLGWVLVHSLWQFTLLAVFAGIARQVLLRNSATVRYCVYAGLLALSVCTPLITWGLQPKANNSLETTQDLGVLTPEFSVSPMTLPDHEFSLEHDANVYVGSTGQPSPGDFGPAPIAFEAVASPVLPTPPLALPSASWSEQLRTLLQSWLPWIVAGWVIGVAICALRPLLGWHTLWRLRHVGVSPVSNDLVAATTRIASRLGLHHTVRVVQSTLARVPVVVGYLSPVILLPVSLMTSIPVAQLESILAHELAHVRRHDFVVNLLQTLVETFFFYHPAIWWISNLIRVEREHCCDDLVVRLLDNRVEYGRALLAIEELRSSARHTLLAPGATDGSLICRVRRIVGLKSDRTVNSPWSVLCLVGCCISAVCTLSVLSWHGIANANLDDAQKPALNDQNETSGDSDEKKGQTSKDATSSLRPNPNPLIAVLQTPPGARLDADGAALSAGMVQRFGSPRFKSTGWWKQLAFAGNDEWLWMKTDNRVEVMHRETGRTVKHGQLRLGEEGVRSIAASPDGTRIAIGFVNPVEGPERATRYRVVLMSAKTTAHMNEWSWKAEPGDLNCLSFSGDGTLLATVGGSNLRLWKTESGDLIKEFNVEPGDFRDAALSPDGQSAVFAGWHSVYFVNFGTGAAPIKLEKQQGSSVCFAPDGRMFATITRDGMRLWDGKTAALIAHLAIDQSYGDADFGIAFSPDSRLLAVPAPQRDILELWDIESRKRIATFPLTNPRGLAISNNGRWLVGAGGDARITFFDLQTRQQVSRPGDSHSQPPLRVRFTGDGGLVTSSYDDARVWDIPTGKQQHLLGSEKPVEIRGLAVSPNGQSIVTNAGDNSIGIWDRSTGKRRSTLKGHGKAGSYRLAEFNSVGDQFATWGSDDQLRLWNVSSGKLVSEHSVQIPGSRELKEPESWTAEVRGSLAPDARALFLRFKQDLFEFETQTGKLIRKVPVEFATAPLAISNDGKWLAVPEEAQRDAKGMKGAINVLLLDRTTLKVVRKWPVGDPHSPGLPSIPATDIPAKPPTQQIQWSIFTSDGSLTFAADSKRLAWSRNGWSDADGNHSGIDVVEVAKDGFLASIPTESGSWAIEFSPDGRQIATGHYDTTTALWDIESPRFAVRPEGDRKRTAVDPVTSPQVGTRVTGTEQQIAMRSDQKPAKDSATGAARPDDAQRLRMQIDAISQRFVTSVKGLKLTFIGDEELETLREELQTELTKRVPRPVDDNWFQRVLKSTELFCTHSNHHHFKFEKDFMTDFEILKWILWTAMDRVQLTPDELKLRESQREWFRQYARSLPDPSQGKIETWRLPDGSEAKMTTLEAKLTELEDVIASPFNPYFAWPFTDIEFKLIQARINERDWLVEKGRGDLSGAPWSVFYPVADLRGPATARRWPIEHRDMCWYSAENNRWQWDSEGAKRPLASLKRNAAKAVPEAATSETAAGAAYTHPITVSGRTLDENGSPIPGATVYLISVPQNQYARLAETKSDANGHYEFVRVPLPIQSVQPNAGGRDLGIFEIFGTAKGKAFAWRPRKTYFPVRNGDSNPSEVLLDGPNKFFEDDPIVLDLTFTTPKSIKGRIVDDDGKPIAQARLEIWGCERFDLELFKRETANSAQELTAINESRGILPDEVKFRSTDSDGQFEFTGLPEECRFSLTVRHPDYAIGHASAATTQQAVPQRRTGSRLQTGDVALALHRTVELPIRVVYGDTAQPAPNVWLNAYDGQVNSSAQSDANGLATLRLPPGKYQTTLLPAKGSRYIETSLTDLNVTDKPGTTPTDLRLKPGCKLDVKIVDAISGQPISDVDLWQSDDLEEPIERRQELFFRSWEKPTIYFGGSASDQQGQLQAILEPGNHRIGACFNHRPQGYRLDEVGQMVSCKASETIQLELKLMPLTPNPFDMLIFGPKVELDKIRKEDLARFWERALYYRERQTPVAEGIYCETIIKAFPGSEFANRARARLKELKPTDQKADPGTKKESPQSPDKPAVGQVPPNNGVDPTAAQLIEQQLATDKFAYRWRFGELKSLIENRDRALEASESVERLENNIAIGRSRVALLKLRIAETGNRSRPGQTSDADLANLKRSTLVRWGLLARGFQIGLERVSLKDTYAAGEAVQFRLRVRNATKAAVETTLRFVPGSKAKWRLNSNDHIYVNNEGGNQTEPVAITLPPESDQPISGTEFRIEANGLLPGRYSVTSNSEVVFKDQNFSGDRALVTPPDSSSLPGDLALTFDVVSSAPPPKQGDPGLFVLQGTPEIFWGDPVQGLQGGLRYTRPLRRPEEFNHVENWTWNLGDTVDAEFYVRNVLPTPVSVSYAVAEGDKPVDLDPYVHRVTIEEGNRGLQPRMNKSRIAYNSGHAPTKAEQTRLLQPGEIALAARMDFQLLETPAMPAERANLPQVNYILVDAAQRYSFQTHLTVKGIVPASLELTSGRARIWMSRGIPKEQVPVATTGHGRVTLRYDISGAAAEATIVIRPLEPAGETLTKLVSNGTKSPEFELSTGLYQISRQTTLKVGDWEKVVACDPHLVKVIPDHAVEVAFVRLPENVVTVKGHWAALASHHVDGAFLTVHRRAERTLDAGAPDTQIDFDAERKILTATSCGPDGRFTLEPLLPGKYVLILRAFRSPTTKDSQGIPMPYLVGAETFSIYSNVAEPGYYPNEFRIRTRWNTPQWVPTRISNAN